jgi:hypothetical protein
MAKIADGRITAIDAIRVGKDSAQLSIAYEFSIDNDGPYSGECLWIPRISSKQRVAATLRKIHVRQHARIRYRPDDPSVNRLDGGARALLRASVTKISTTRH